MFIKQKSGNHESKKCVYIQLSLPIRSFSYLFVCSMTSCIICTNCNNRFGYIGYYLYLCIRLRKNDQRNDRRYRYHFATHL